MLLRIIFRQASAKGWMPLRNVLASHTVALLFYVGMHVRTSSCLRCCRCHACCSITQRTAKQRHIKASTNTVLLFTDPLSFCYITTCGLRKILRKRRRALFCLQRSSQKRAHEEPSDANRLEALWGLTKGSNWTRHCCNW
jgi:hypothetical protein